MTPGRGYGPARRRYLSDPRVPTARCPADKHKGASHEDGTSSTCATARPLHEEDYIAPRTLKRGGRWLEENATQDGFSSGWIRGIPTSLFDRRPTTWRSMTGRL